MNAELAMKDMKNETKKTVRVVVFIALAVAAVGLSACNTVRGMAQDVTDVADAIDPSK